jgi:hypothetical protein
MGWVFGCIAIGAVVNASVSFGTCPADRLSNQKLRGDSSLGYLVYQLFWSDYFL